MAAQGLLVELMPGMFRTYASLASTHHARLRAAVKRILLAGGGMTRVELYRAVAESSGVSGKVASEVIADMMAIGMLSTGESGKVVVG